MNVIRCFTQRNALQIKMKVSNRRKRYDVLQNTASAEMEGIMDQTTRLILAAVVGMILLLVLIIKFKIHAMLSILIGAITIGLIAGMPFSQIVTAVNDGIGNTLKGIALLVGLVQFLKRRAAHRHLPLQWSTGLAIKKRHGRWVLQDWLLQCRYSLMQD